MADKKIDEDNPFGDFNDEFDFGDESFDAQPSPPPTSGGPKRPNRAILLIALVAVIVTIGYFGYKFFSSDSGSAPTTAQMTPAQLAAIQKTTTTGQDETFGIEQTQTPIIKETVKKEIIQPGTEAASKAQASVIPKTPAAGTAPATQSTNAKTPNTSETSTVLESAKTETSKKSEVAEKAKSTIADLQRELFTPETPPTTAASQKPAQTAQTTPPPSPATPTPPPAAAKPAAKDVPLTSKIDADQLLKAMEALTLLNKQMENNLNQVKYLEAYTKEITETVTKLNTQISAMDNRILALTNTANSLSKDVGSVRTEVGQVKQVLGDEGLYLETAPRRVGVAAVKEVPIISNVPRKCLPGEALIAAQAPEYSLHAVIPGRAWLKSSTGQILTVTEGEVLGNYGKILVIDAANSIVLTNTGFTFR